MFYYDYVIVIIFRTGIQTLRFKYCTLILVQTCYLLLYKGKNIF